MKKRFRAALACMLACVMVITMTGINSFAESSDMDANNYWIGLQNDLYQSQMLPKDEATIRADVYHYDEETEAGKRDDNNWDYEWSVYQITGFHGTESGMSMSPSLSPTLPDWIDFQADKEQLTITTDKEDVIGSPVNLLVKVQATNREITIESSMFVQICNEIYVVELHDETGKCIANNITLSMNVGDTIALTPVSYKKTIAGKEEIKDAYYSWRSYAYNGETEPFTFDYSRCTDIKNTGGMMAYQGTVLATKQIDENATITAELLSENVYSSTNYVYYAYNSLGIQEETVEDIEYQYTIYMHDLESNFMHNLESNFNMLGMIPGQAKSYQMSLYKTWETDGMIQSVPVKDVEWKVSKVQSVDGCSYDVDGDVLTISYDQDVIYDPLNNTLNTFKIEAVQNGSTIVSKEWSIGVQAYYYSGNIAWENNDANGMIMLDNGESVVISPELYIHDATNPKGRKVTDFYVEASQSEGDLLEITSEHNLDVEVHGAKKTLHQGPIEVRRKKEGQTNIWVSFYIKDSTDNWMQVFSTTCMVHDAIDLDSAYAMTYFSGIGSTQLLPGESVEFQTMISGNGMCSQVPDTVTYNVTAHPQTYSSDVGEVNIDDVISISQSGNKIKVTAKEVDQKYNISISATATYKDHEYTSSTGCSVVDAYYSLDFKGIDGYVSLDENQSVIITPVLMRHDKEHPEGIISDEEFYVSVGSLGDASALTIEPADETGSVYNWGTQTYVKGPVRVTRKDQTVRYIGCIAAQITESENHYWMHYGSADVHIVNTTHQCSFGVPVYEWSDDYTSCTAVMTCTEDDSHVQRIPMVINSQITKKATCEEKGETTYVATAEYHGVTLQDSKVLADVPALGHNYEVVSTKDATCTAAGEVTYVCTNDRSHTYTESIAVLGHKWKNPEFVWSADGKSAKVLYTCERDSNHTEEYDATVTAVIKAAATCAKNGITEYTAKFRELVATITKEDIPAKGHTWGEEIVVPATCVKEGSVTKICSECGEKRVETLVKDNTKHAHTEIRDALDATTEAEGYTGDVYCVECGVEISKGQTIPKIEKSVEKTDEGTKTTTVEKVGDKTTTTIEVEKVDGSKVITTDVVEKVGDKTTTSKTTEEEKKDGSKVTTTEIVDSTGAKTTAVSTTTQSGEKQIETKKETNTAKANIKTEVSADKRVKAEANVTITEKNKSTEIQGQDVKALATTVVQDVKAVVEEVIAQSTEASKGANKVETPSVKVDMKDTYGEVATAVPTEVLDAIKGSNVDVVLDMGDYSWSINGSDIDDVKNINLEVNMGGNAIAQDLVDQVAEGTNDTQQISLAYDGMFGFQAKLSTYMGRENAGKYSDLYYFNEKTGRLEFQGSSRVDDRGMAEFTFTHASDYVAAVKTTANDSCAGGHSYDEGVVTTAATCHTTGVKTCTCSVCHATKTESLPVDMTNHDGETETRDVKSATDTEDGYSGDVYCKSCNTCLSTGTAVKKIKCQADKHEWGNSVVVKNATCATEGSQIVTCTICGEKKTETIAKVTGKHSGPLVIVGAKKATYQEDGYTGDTVCKTCGEKVKIGASINKLVCGEHQFVAEVTKQPTCTAEGTKTLTCTICGDTKTEVIAKTAHIAGIPVRENVVTPTVNKEGSHDEVEYCKVCGSELSRKTITDPSITTGSTVTTVDGKEVVALNNATESYVIDQIKNATKSVVVDMKTSDGKTAQVVSKNMLEAMQGKDITVTFDMGTYQWTINGKTITSTKNVNLGVNLDANVIPQTVVQALAGERVSKQISLDYDGEFGFEAKLTLNLGEEYAGKYGNLYYYNNDRLDFMNAGLIATDGSVDLTFTHASDYVVVIDDQAAVIASNNSSDQQLTATSAQKPTESTGAAKTGDTNHMALYLMLLLIAVGLIGYALKKKEH